jgi:uncharacterized RDD family membrane protein YckC
MASRTLELPHTLVEAPPAGTMSAGLAVRLAASAIDLVIVGTVVVVAALAAHLVLALLPASVSQADTGMWGLAALTVVVVTGYFVYFWGIEGATPGKKLMGLTLTRPGTLETRKPIGPARALLRLVGITAGNILFVDVIVAFLHRDRRALHDMIADSIVVEVR